MIVALFIVTFDDINVWSLCSTSLIDTASKQSAVGMTINGKNEKKEGVKAKSIQEERPVYHRSMTEL